jgi:type I restriction enzyme, S subunit
MVTFPKHESYKDSGVTWMGDIPTNWLVKSIKYISLVNPSGDRARKDEQVTFLPIEAVFVNGQYDLSRVDDRSAFPASLTEFKKEDVLLAKITPCFENGKGAFLEQLQTNKGIGSTEFHVFRVCQNQLNPKFLYYAIHNESFRAYAQVFMEGTAGQKRVTTPFISNNKIPVPSIEEQERIVNFLDCKTAAIDQAIAQKLRLIELLQEQKAILINQAVTKGLNPNASMRYSGVDWIGQIPEHWEIRRAKYLFREIDERSKTGDEELLSVSHITGVTPRSEKNVNMFLAEDYSGSKLCRKDDLVINIMWAWMGALGISCQTGIVSPSYGVFRQLKTKIFNSWYLEHLLRSIEYIAQYNRISTGLHSSRLRLYADMFLNMEILLPPKNEQDQIEAIATDQTKEIDTAVKAIEREIEVIKELRSILISQAVTGKINVLGKLYD